MNNIRADYVRIILMEANGDCSPLDIPALERLMMACIIADLPTIQVQASPTNRSRAASAARFILRKHEFATARHDSETQHAKAH
jgi:hypothetical protein